MSFLWSAWGAAAVIVWVGIAVVWFRGVRRMADVGCQAPAGGPGPLVSLVVPARDEERRLEDSLRSVLAQDYPAVEVIAVDDRSTDGTAGILARLRTQHPTLQVLTVAELPDGWLGKNHALSLGAGVARGEWLLFTDADVRFSRDCVGKAVAFARERGLDHLTLFPAFVARGTLLRSFVLSFFLLFCLYSRPWRARNPRSRDHVGVGVFNLVKRSAYEAVGTHEAIRLRPDDDLALGGLLKGRGFRQEAGFGRTLLAIEWYASLGEASCGLEKNALVPFRYRPELVVLGCALAFGVHVAPAAACFLASGWAAAALCLATVLQLLVCADEARSSGLPSWQGFLHPVGTSLVLAAVLRAAWLAVRRGGVQWRGTWYPLDRLRRSG